MASSASTDRPPPCAPRGFNRCEAARYIGVGLSKFDEMVKDGRMPAPRCIDARRVWDRLELDAAFDDLPNPQQRNPWDGVA